MDIETFRRLVSKARAKNPNCCYCGKDLSAIKRVMYMRGQRRIACAECPEAILVPVSNADRDRHA